MNRGITRIYTVILTVALTLGLFACGSSSSSKKKAPAAPTGVTATSNDSNQVMITWTPVSGASTYNIYSGTTPGVTPANGARITAAFPGYVHRGLNNGATYYYVVTALGGTREGAESSETSAVPLAAPSASAGGGTSQVTLTWGSVLGATSYNVYSSTTSGVSKATGNQVSGVSSPYAHTGLTDGTTYYYVVTAVSSVGGGSESSESPGDFAVPLAAPTGVSATSGANEVIVDWISAPAATSYNIYWDTAPGVTTATGNLIAGVASPYAHTGLDNAATYYYVVTSLSLLGGGTESVESAEASAAPTPAGSLDPTFGGGRGFISHDGAAGRTDDDEGRAIIVDATGRILVTGHGRNNAFNDDMVIWRFNDDGNLDTTFNGRGWVSHGGAAGGTGTDSGEGIAVDTSGRIVVAGYSTNAGANIDMVIWRFNGDGTLDTTFDGQGWVVHDAAGGAVNGSDYGRGIALDSTGRIVVAGYSQSAGSGDDMVVWRFNPDGTLDTAFDGQGWVTHDSAAGGASTDRGWSITLDASGKILVAGESRNTNFNDDMAIWRLNPDGTFDATFNGQGWVTHDGAASPGSTDEGYSITVDASAKIVVAGTSDDSNDDFAVWRFNPDGTLDTTFNGQGWTVTNSIGGGRYWDDEARGVAVTASGRVLAAGWTQTALGSTGRYDMALVAYRDDGLLDPLFGM
ncbi:MAG: hypothetical protein O7H41_12445, partial [Planctomycetota bacterium]|nr:hypothetical protein [Planctomycetota bacterium]